jgi:hypothetical protein
MLFNMWPGYYVVYAVVQMDSYEKFPKGKMRNMKVLTITEPETQVRPLSWAQEVSELHKRTSENNL